MLILGIETSCDETAVAVVENGHKVFSSVVFSSSFAHKQFGGVVPEIAVRFHLQKINPILKKAKVSFKEIRAIAVTYGPGLIGALLVGVSFAKGLAFSKKIPLIKINHLLAHLYAPFLNSSIGPGNVFPAVGMIISGGHTILAYLRDFKHCELLGQTRDDAVGEAFDKVAKILNLGYPGGPIIDRLALKGDANKIKFNCARLKGGLDFSFSGIKTAVLYKSRGQSTENRKQKTENRKTRNPFSASRFPLPEDIAASFQKSVVDVLIEKAIAACSLKNCRNLILGGGVTANSYFKKELFRKTAQKKIKLFYPQPKFCTDNAAMVAGLAYHLQDKKHFADLDLTPCAGLGID